MKRVKIHKKYEDAFYIAVGSEWFAGWSWLSMDLCLLSSRYQNAKRFITARAVVKAAEKIDRKWKIIQIDSMEDNSDESSISF